MRGILPLAFVALLVIGGLSGCVSQGTTSKDQSGAREIKASGRAQEAVFPGTYKVDGRYSQTLVEGTFAALPPQKVFVKSAIDGADIEIGFHRPDVPEGVKVPIIVQASPYHRVSGDVVSLRGMMLFLHDNFLPHGYAVAGISVRGTGNSGGCMDLMGSKEVRDLDQAINWLGSQPWTNGNIGMIGVSYDGSTPWDVAATGNKHLKTIVPISGLPDIFGLMYRNGSAEQRGALLVNALYYTYGPSPDDIAGQQNDAFKRAPERRVQGSACPDYAVGFGAAGWSTVAGDRDPTGYWAERNRKPAIEKNYRGSILLVQGLQDWNVDPSLVIPWVNVLNNSGAPLKQMLGQWGHANPDRTTGPGQGVPTTRWDWAEILLHWFDKYLKQLPNVQTGPAVQVQDHLFGWRNEDSFPPQANWTTWHLASGNALTPTRGAAGSVRLTPAAMLGDNPYAQNVRALPGYMADFTTPPAEKTMVISGLPRLHVTITPDGPGGHVAGFLYDVDASGAEKRVGWTMMNLQFADGTETRRPLTPGQPVVAKMEFQPLDVRIEPGHRLKVRIWEFTEADRIPALPPEPVTLNWGGSVKSVLELPLLDRTPEDYFTPPGPR